MIRHTHLRRGDIGGSRTTGLRRRLPTAAAAYIAGDIARDIVFEPLQCLLSSAFVSMYFSFLLYSLNSFVTVFNSFVVFETAAHPAQHI
jgi:hypothetical protein